MSGENIADIKTNINEPITGKKIPSEKKMGSRSRVDINNLMSKVREEERKQKKENLIFFGFISGIIITTRIIASL